MKSISQIRSLIESIPGAIRRIPPEERERSEDPAVKNLWNISENLNQEYSAPIEQPNSNFSIGRNLLPPEEIFEYGAEIDEAQLQEALGGNKGNDIRKAVEDNGVDALGWYVPFHYSGVQPGIYIPISSIFWLAVNVFDKLDSDPWSKFKLSFRAIHQHELFHFSGEYFMTQFEAIYGVPIYWRSKDEKRDPEYGYDLIEEELANAQMLLAIKYASSNLKIKGKTKVLSNFIKMQPEGYCDALGYNKSNFESECNVHALCHLSSRVQFPNNDDAYIENFDFLPLYPRFPQQDWQYCPIHIIHDQERFNLPLASLDLFRFIPSLIETDKFLKALKKLPTDIQSKWEKAKVILRTTTSMAGLDFKFWEKKDSLSIYSIRLNRSYRAHLGYDSSEKSWHALSVGNHKQMGHG